jgi:hypothetical protein
MGYSTEFTGHVTVTPPLNPAEITYLRKFADSRRMNRPEGPYDTTDYYYGQLTQEQLNRPPAGQPGLWCNWAPTDDGATIQWNQAEKFYYSTEWMQYLVDHFLKPGGHAHGEPGFDEFTFDHVVNGTIDAQGDDPDDTWQLIVIDNLASNTRPVNF